MSLPSGYKRLEYIESSGTQFIDTGFKPNQDTRVLLDADYTKIGTWICLFGAEDDSNITNGFELWETTSQAISFYYGSATNMVQTIPTSGRHVFDCDKNVYKVDNSITLTNGAATFSCANSLYLFAILRTGSVEFKSAYKLYSCQIYDNGTLVRDFVPCINASGEIGLYDLVDKQFYGNTGTGTFTAGPVIAISVALSDIRELEYIESSGTQYVDSGFKPNNNSRVVLDFEPTVAYSSIVGIFGIRDANSGTAANMFVFWNNGASTFRTDYFGTQKTMTIPTLLARQTVDKDKNVTTIGSVSVSNTVSTGQCSNNLYLFCTNNVGKAQYFSKLKLYSCKIYDNGTIIRDYIPAKLSDGTVGLYDKLNGLLYINAGTGTFISGYTSLETGDILNYAYTGAVQSVTLPKGVYKLEVWGAQGGYRSSSSYGGKGGYSVGTVVITQPTNIFIYVGGSGNTGGTSGGFNGGGARHTYKGGGGASDIRIGQDSLYARVIVAGGGGSDGATNKKGMYGGGTAGGSTSENYGTGGYGGTQTGVSSSSWQTTTHSTSTTSQSGAYAGFGFGGNGIYRSNGYGGAGGGGWYGGSGSYPDGSGDDDRGGGGGSGFVWTGSNAPSGYLLGSEYYLTDASTIAGNASMPSTSGRTETGHTGNGYARITAIKVDSLNLPVNIGGTWKEANEAFVNIGGTWKTVEAAFVNIGGTWKELG